jgi:hypothetical protein
VGKWEEFLENVKEKTVWTAHRFIDKAPTDRGNMQVPTLATKRDNGGTQIANTNEEKARMLFEAFFSLPAPSNNQILKDFECPLPAFKFNPITDDQIQRAIDCTSPYKVPGTDGIPNCVLKTMC